MRLLLLFIIFSTAHAGVLIRTSGYGDLSTSLDVTQCQAYATELGSPYSWDSNSPVDSTGQATGCSVVESNNKVRFNSNANGQPCSGSLKCIDFVLDIPPEEYIPLDPGEISSLDSARWTVASANCGAKFALQTNTDSWSHTCEDCNREAFMAKYLSQYGLVIQEINGVNKYVRDSDADLGTVHGLCCVNPHHSVCAAMLSEYKSKCEGEGIQTKGKGVICLGTDNVDYECVLGANNQVCQNGGVVTGTCAFDAATAACTGCSCDCSGTGKSGDNCEID